MSVLRKKRWILAVLFWALTVSPSIAEDFLKNVSPQDSAVIIAENKDNADFKILDVRTPAEYVSGHLGEAEMLDFYSDSFANELQKLDKNKTYLIYCRSGGRSGQTLSMMKELGFKKVYNMSGGFLGWQSESLPIIQ